MKILSMSRVLGLTASLASMGVVHADELLATIGAGPNDGLTFTSACSPDTDGPTKAYYFQVEGKTAGRTFLAKITVTKNGVSKSVNDPTNGNGQSGPMTSVDQGDGVYTVVISKELRPGETSTNGNMQVGVTSHCQAANGGHTIQQSSQPISIQIPNPNPPQPKPPVPTPSPAPGFSAALNNKVEARRYAVECMAKKGLDTQRYRFRIRGVSKAAPFNARMTVSIDGSEGVEAVDPINTDTNFSEWQEISGGNNVYRLTIDKVSKSGNTVGTLPFRVQHECVSETGSRTRLKGPKKLP